MISGVDLLTINPTSGQERDPRRHSDIGTFDRKFSKNQRWTSNKSFFSVWIGDAQNEAMKSKFLLQHTSEIIE